MHHLRSIRISILSKELGQLWYIGTRDLPRDSPVDLTISMGDKISKTLNLTPWVIRKCAYHIIRQVKSVLSNTIDGSHNGVINQLPVFRAIMYELFLVKRETPEPICENLRIFQNNVNEFDIAIKLFHKAAPHLAECAF